MSFSDDVLNILRGRAAQDVVQRDAASVDARSAIACRAHDAGGTELNAVTTANNILVLDYEYGPQTAAGQLAMFNPKDVTVLTIRRRGIYVIRLSGRFVGSGGGGERYIAVKKNGSAWLPTVYSASGVGLDMTLYVISIDDCLVGDTFGIESYQTSGGNLTVGPFYLEIAMLFPL